jgi:putative ABC transport system permease protein
MFWRLLWRMLRGSRGRLTVALIALISGAAVVSALLNLDLDVERKLTQEFRALGANLVISSGRAPQAADPSAGAVANSSSLAAQPTLMDASDALGSVEKVKTGDQIAAAPYLYIVARAGGKPLVVAGTWLDQARGLAPTWKLDGNWVASRDDETQCLVGRNVARQFQLVPGSEFELSYQGQIARLRVAGIVDAGDADDDQTFVNLPVAQKLAGLDGKIQIVQLSVSGNAASIGAYQSRLASALPAYTVSPIRQVTEAEGGLLNRIHLLIVSMIVLILALTALCVLATMAALAMERREDVGLMKALGGSISRIVSIFLAEVGVLGAIGGLIGCFAGLVLSNWMGQRVFGTSIAPRWEVLPITIVLTVAVAMAGALPLRLLGKIKPAVILRGE